MAHGGGPPGVSIGLFVYNGEAHIRNALGSLLSQTYGDFELIISDNASTDSTEEICREFASRDPRIRFIRQNTNRGAAANLQFVFDQSRAEFFMWAAADDVKTPTFLDANLRALRQDRSLVASTSPNCFEGDEMLPGALVTFALRGSLFNRLSGFLAHSWRSHGIFYSLIRRQALAGCDVFGRSVIAADWMFDVHLLMQGEIGRVAEGRLISGRAGISSAKDHYETFSTKHIERVLPLYEFSKRTSRLILASNDLSSAQKRSLLAMIVELNARTAYSEGRGRLSRRKAMWRRRGSVSARPTESR